MSTFRIRNTSTRTRPLVISYAHSPPPRTPLHYALQRKNMNLVRILVQAGADVNASDNNGSSGLHYAVTYAERTSR